MQPQTPLPTNVLPDVKGKITRRTAGGCYNVRGTEVSPVLDGSPRAASLAHWRERQADLRGESWAIIHLDRHLTDEEHGLFFAMGRELLIVDNAVLRLEAGSPSS